MDVRANRRNAAQRANTVSIIKGNFEKLVQINELIIDVNACLEQRILKTRHLCTERLNAYILGVREVHLEFDNNIEYDNSASIMYETKHKVCDDAMIEVSFLMKQLLMASLRGIKTFANYTVVRANPTIITVLV